MQACLYSNISISHARHCQLFLLLECRYTETAFAYVYETRLVKVFAFEAGKNKGRSVSNFW